MVHMGGHILEEADLFRAQVKPGGGEEGKGDRHSAAGMSL